MSVFCAIGCANGKLTEYLFMSSLYCSSLFLVLSLQLGRELVTIYALIEKKK